MTYRLLGDPVGIRTPNLLIRSQVLYPVELQSRFSAERGAKILPQIKPPNPLP